MHVRGRWEVFPVILQNLKLPVFWRDDGSSCLTSALGVKPYENDKMDISFHISVPRDAILHEGVLTTKIIINHKFVVKEGF